MRTVLLQIKSYLSISSLKLVKREFYAMSPESAYALLEAIAQIHGCTDKLKLWEMDAAVLPGTKPKIWHNFNETYGGNSPENAKCPTGK